MTAYVRSGWGQDVTWHITSLRLSLPRQQWLKPLCLVSPVSYLDSRQGVLVVEQFTSIHTTTTVGH